MRHLVEAWQQTSGSTMTIYRGISAVGEHVPGYRDALAQERWTDAGRLLLDYVLREWGGLGQWWVNKNKDMIHYYAGTALFTAEIDRSLYIDSQLPFGTPLLLTDIEVEVPGPIPFGMLIPDSYRWQSIMPPGGPIEVVT